MTEQPDPITDPCDCNQPGAVHQRGDEGFCRALAAAGPETGQAHESVALVDLRARMAAAFAAADLDALVREAEEMGLYEATSGRNPLIREEET